MFALVDLALLGACYTLARVGWRRGFATQALDLFGFGIGLIAALRFYRLPAAPLRWVGVGPGTAYVVGGALIFVPIIIAVALLGLKVNRVTWQPGIHLTNRVVGAGFGVALATTAMTFLMLVSQLAPLPLGLSDAVRRSPSGRLLLSSAFPATRILQRVAARDAEKMILYLRQSLRLQRSDERPEVDEAPPMRFPPAAAHEIAVDEGAEQDLFRLVNEERTKRGLRALTYDERLRDLGRSHSFDMYVQGYFAHRGMDGSSPSERMTRARIEYVVSGENLAIAPSVSMAHDGLMRSPGHRRNILDPEFTSLGIGIYNGPRGLIATQQFCGGC
ncbi:MAG TPA: CvpA family protein [Actinomycetota bacterium]|jgi:uncharacterized protein YkwD/uncharacterized membrane protein required for colicin V production|nr:CvpA family protein [Actinomycetota bacterium]